MPNNKIQFIVNKNDEKRLLNKLKSLDKFGETDVDKIMQNESVKTVDRMENNAPFDTGRLRRNIDFSHQVDIIEFYSEAIDPETKKDYAPSQEFGGRFFRAQPYFYKNIKKHLQNVRVALANRIQDIIIRNK